MNLYMITCSVNTGTEEQPSYEKSVQFAVAENDENIKPKVDKAIDRIDAEFPTRTGGIEYRTAIIREVDNHKIIAVPKDPGYEQS